MAHFAKILGTHFAYYENIDLYSFASILAANSSDPDVVSAANNLMPAIQAAVYYRNTGFYESAPAYGLAVLLADYSTWPYYSGPTQYVQLSMSYDTEWNEFIQDHFAVGSTIDTLTASITWNSGNCDLWVMDNGMIYSASDGPTPNGSFSGDAWNGGTESWTLNQPHAPCRPLFALTSYDYSGSVTYHLIHNGVDSTGTITVSPNSFYLLAQVDVKSPVRVKAIKLDTLPGLSLRKN